MLREAGLAMRAWALVVLSLGAGCDLSVHPFAGTIVQMSIIGAKVSAPGKHLELWTTDQYGDVIRVSAKNKSMTGDSPGMRIVTAITLDDPCMIDAKGNLLVTPDAYPSTVVVDGQTQDPQQQADTVINRIKQVLSIDDGGLQGTPSLLAVIPFTTSLPPVLDPMTTSAAARLAACNQYWTDPLAYTPNPAQFTNPQHGQVYGFVAFQTQDPPAGYDGLRMDSPDNLFGAQELFMTVENDAVDAHNRGPLFLEGLPLPVQDAGRGWVEFNLSGQNVSGTAALLVQADQDPTMF